MRIELKDIKQYQIFWECQSGNNARFVAMHDAVRVSEGWMVNGMSDTRKPEQFFVSDAAGGSYGPRLYTEPAYVSAADLRLS